MALCSSASAVTAVLSKESNGIHSRGSGFSFWSVNAAAKRNLCFSFKKKSSVICAKQEQALEYRKVGDSDLLISEITLGTVSIT